IVQNDVISSWTWDFGNGMISNQQNPSTVYTISAPTNVTLTVATNNCSAQITKSVTPRPLPTVTPIASQGCSPHTVSMSIPTEANVLYQWNFGDGAVSS